MGRLIYLIWNFSQPVLLAMAFAYVGSGIVIRIGGGCAAVSVPAPPEPR